MSQVLTYGLELGSEKLSGLSVETQEINAGKKEIDLGMGI